MFHFCKENERDNAAEKVIPLYKPSIEILDTRVSAQVYPTRKDRESLPRLKTKIMVCITFVTTVQTRETSGHRTSNQAGSC